MTILIYITIKLHDMFGLIVDDTIRKKMASQKMKWKMKSNTLHQKERYKSNMNFVWYPGIVPGHMMALEGQQKRI